MNIELSSQGSLFTSGFLTETIESTPQWRALGEADLDQFEVCAREVFDRFPQSQSPNESQTEDNLIWPILEVLGWTETLCAIRICQQGAAKMSPMVCCLKALQRCNEVARY